MSTPSSLTELPFRSPDSSSLANASLEKNKTMESQVSITPTTMRQRSETSEVLIDKCFLFVTADRQYINM